MAITVKFFASLREEMGQSEASLENDEITTVQDIWNAVANGREMPANILCSVNMDYVSPEHKIEDGDEVAFFPPVTGG